MASFESKREVAPAQEKTRGTLEQAIQESGAIVVDRGTPQTDVALDRTRFPELPEEVAKAVESVAERAVAYLALPLILDAFEDHNLRREWRTAIKETYTPDTAAFFESNRLRVNHLQPLFFKLPGLQAALSGLPATHDLSRLKGAVDRLMELSGPVPSFEMRYRPLALDEKVAFTREFSAALRDYVGLVAERGQQEEALAA